MYEGATALQRHILHVTLPTAGVTEITLSRMTVALAAILDPGLCSRPQFCSHLHRTRL